MVIVALIAACIFGSVTLISWGLFARKETSAIEARIADFRNRSVFQEDGEMDLSLPFVERVLKPSVEGMARTMSKVLPASLIADVQKQLVMAGSPMKLNTFLSFWAVAMATLAAMGLMMFAVLPNSLILQKVMISASMTALGWMAPRMWLKAQVKARQKLIIKALPDALDLVTTCVEAGLGLDAALARVSEKSSGPLAMELSRMLRDVAMGKLRKEAITEMAERCGVEELTSFVNSVIQAEQLGVGIAQVLRVQSDQLRVKRRQRAEQAAHEAPIKMLFPLVMFIFPAFLLVILGPAAIRIAQSFS